MAAIPYTPPRPVAPAPPAVPSNELDQHDPLFQGLVKHVTAGRSPEHITQKRLMTMIKEAISQPGGRDYLEALTNGKDANKSQAGQIWEEDQTATGDIYLKVSSFGFKLIFLETGGGVSGHKALFVKEEARIPVNGTLYYNKKKEIGSDAGSAEFVAYTTKDPSGTTQLHIDFIRHEKAIATFVCEDFPSNALPPYSVSGKAHFTHIQKSSADEEDDDAVVFSPGPTVGVAA